MEFSILHIIFYALLVDSVVANICAWSNKQEWWNALLGKYATHIPLVKGWVTMYLLLTLFIGYLIFQ